MASVIGLVASGMGVALVPSMAQRLQISDVRYVPLVDKNAYMDFAFAWNKDNRSPVIHAFLAVARNTLKLKNQTTTARRGKQYKVVRGSRGLESS